MALNTVFSIHVGVLTLTAMEKYLKVGVNAKLR